MDRVEVDISGFWKRLSATVVLLMVFIVSVAAAFLEIHRQIAGPYCNCGSSLLLTVVAMATSGIVVGIAIYYLLSGSFQSEREDLREKARETTRFLPEKQRKLLELLVENEGEMLQKEMVEDGGMDKVTVSRTLKKMEKRGIVSREENGISKKVKVIDDFGDLLLEK